jgi:hypothetical protein
VLTRQLCRLSRETVDEFTAFIAAEVTDQDKDQDYVEAEGCARVEVTVGSERAVRLLSATSRAYEKVRMKKIGEARAAKATARKEGEPRETKVAKAAARRLQLKQQLKQYM